MHGFYDQGFQCPLRGQLSYVFHEKELCPLYTFRLVIENLNLLIDN